MFKRTVFFIFLLMPSALAYFQQHVNYDIQVKLFPELNRLEAYEQITYYNNSPDTLRDLFFHLYMNTFKAPENDRVDHKNSGYVEIVSVRDRLNRELTFRIEGTVMKLELRRPLSPADSLLLHIRFNTILPPAGDRFGYYGYHYDVGNWYPVPAVYDERGWHADQHVGGEFYQEWGNYRVDISVPKGFVVGATGRLINPDVLPDSVEYSQRKVRYYVWSDTGYVTYRYRAPQVHDFAWTADPEYYIRFEQAGDVLIRFLILPYRSQEWEKQLSVAGQAVELFSGKIGPYPYPELTVADSYIKAGGIEYPNLVLINDMIYDSLSLSATIIHEIAHQWFYGLLANNQTRYGWMDEGFATYLEGLGMSEIFKKENTYLNSPPGFWGKYFGYRIDFTKAFLLAYLSYIRKPGEEPINRHFDWFQNDPFTPYYDKMSLVITQLQLVMGDSLFWEGVREYYRTWRFRHPYPENLFKSFEDVYGQNLNWFFEEWLNTTWHCDYSVAKYGGSWRTDSHGKYFDSYILFRRKRPIVMPFEYRLTLADDSTLRRRIKVAGGSNFSDSSESGNHVWPFYRKYKLVRLNLSEEIKHIEIDPDGKLLDINPFNNDGRFWPRIHWYWLHRQYFQPHTDGYTATVFPFIFYNRVDGLQPGVRTRGNYIFRDYQHRSRLLFSLRSLRPETELWFEHPLYEVHPDLHVVWNGYHAAGRWGTGAWLQIKSSKPDSKFRITTGWQFRRLDDPDYLAFPVSTASLSYLEGVVNYGSWANGFRPLGWELKLSGENSFFGSDFNYQKWLLHATFRVPLIFSQKLFGELTTGEFYGQPPLQKRFRLGGGTGYELFRNPYLRAVGILPEAWWQNGHVFFPGGGNLRSLAGDWNQPHSSLVSGYLSLSLGNPLNLTFHYVPYLSDIILAAYTSWASPGVSWGQFKKYFGEAGFTISLTRLPFIFQYFDLEQIHFDFPVLVNEKIEPDSFQFRYVIRIDFRTFY